MEGEVKHMKRERIFCFPFLLVLSLSACGGSAPTSGDPIGSDDLPLREKDDNYQAFYELVPYSFADSNGDRIGDLKGVEDKLGYLADLNYTGIWMTPIFPSPTYHKYDATDYFNIDPQFGNLEDFDSLVTKAHEKGIKVILDLAVNHTSNSHEWFKKCCQAWVDEDTSNYYYSFYNIQERSAGGAWHSVPGSNKYAYEGQFWSGMPDLNLQDVLDNPDGNLANELKRIFQFWLGDHNVDGFRLDAVTSYFTSSKDKNLEFMTWLNNECKAINDDCYLVGEGSWSGNSSENRTYQDSGVDSFFNFMNQSAAELYSIPSAILARDASKLAKGMSQQWKTASNGIPANFIGNHDTVRLVGPTGGRSNALAAKFGHTLLGILPGAIFNYYGDETGQSVPINGNEDPDKRLHVEWGDSYVTNDPPGSCTYDKEATYPYGTVKAQLADPDSIVSHVKKVNLLRKQFPEIARGTTALIDEKEMEDDTVIAVISKKTETSEIYLVINPSTTKSYQYNFAHLEGYKPVAELSVSGKSTAKSGTLFLEPGALVVLAKS